MDSNKSLPKKIRIKCQTKPSAPENVLVQTSTKNVLSLFSGAGGDTYGFEQAGWNVTHFSEFNDAATKTHLAQFPSSALLTGPNNSKNIKDIPDATFETLQGKIDLVFAGFPCQGFSHAGKKRTNDPRNELVHEFVRVTRIIKPTWIIGENVKGLLSRKGVYPANTAPRPVIQIIRELFESIGYKITYRVIDATEVGVPQLRKRLIIIGHKGEEYPHAPWDQLHTQSSTPTIRGVLSSTLEGAVELPAKYAPATQPSRYWISTTESEIHGIPHPNLLRLVEGKRNWSSKEKDDPSEQVLANDYCIEPEGLISFGVRKSGYHGQVLDPDAPSKTIICAYNQCPRLFVGLHNPTTGKYYVRCLTPVECGQIQGFPKDYKWRGSHKDQIVQIGNAVPPPLASCVAKLLEKITFAPTPQINQESSSKQEDSSDEE